ncbi:MAG: YicC family protein [Rhodobacteraceae bacterium]|nr:YicC family protein [Thioclava sp. L04-15]TNE83257.1 MAG: YicC family protein [Paracoccaceae bacterium]TNF11509.1 MAG: YicC family protein [Paracoccaceae bacterium]
MTGFASGQGAAAGHDWSWDIRSVNGKGFDLRMRLPELEGLEAALRKLVSERVSRGNVSLNLRLTHSDAAEALRIDPAALEVAITVAEAVQDAARARGLPIEPMRAGDLLALRGVVEHGAPPVTDPEALRNAILADIEEGLGCFAAMRASEGAEIGVVIGAQLDTIEDLVAQAATAAAARKPSAAETMRAALTRVIEAAPDLDEPRIVQELALIAIKNDVTEEIDRLRVHVSAARALLAEAGPVGRKFEFLTQEFVREANTLCSKSGDAALTQIGLALKYAIDQMREQIQNVE